MPRLFAALAFVLPFAIACGGAVPVRDGHPKLAAAPRVPDPPRGTRPALTRRVPLRFELEGRRFPLPVVHGTVGGQPTWMLVDTGANSHVVAGWLARKLGIKLNQLGDVGTDHVGKTIATYRVDRPNVTVDDWGKLQDGPMLATDVPEVIERLGIGAFISPQRLVEEGDAVIVDLVASEVRAAYFDESERELSAGGKALVSAGARACEDNESTIKGLAFVVPATIDGRAAQLLVDTGAQRSDLLASSTGGKELARFSVPSREPMYTASGKISARTLKGAKVTVGEWTVAADVDLVPGASDSSCPRDGVLSMDVLRGCVLLLGRSKMVGRCN